MNRNQLFFENNSLTLITALFIFLFVYTATGKIFDFASFRAVLHKSPFIGDKAPVVAWALPFLEFGISLLLLFPRTRRQGLWLSFVLLFLFTAYLLLMSFIAPRWSLYSIGILNQLTWLQHVIINIFFMLLAVTGLFGSRRTTVPEPRFIYSAMC